MKLGISRAPNMSTASPRPTNGYHPYISIYVCPCGPSPAQAGLTAFKWQQPRKKAEWQQPSNLPASLFRLASEFFFAFEFPLNISSHLLLHPGSKYLFSPVSRWVSDRHAAARAARQGLVLPVAGDSLVSEVSVLAGLTQPLILWQQIEIKRNFPCIWGSFSDMVVPIWLYVLDVCRICEDPIVCLLRCLAGFSHFCMLDHSAAPLPPKDCCGSLLPQSSQGLVNAMFPLRKVVTLKSCHWKPVR